MDDAADDLASLSRTLSDLLVAFRRGSTLSQQELSRRLGYSRSTIATAETGHRIPASDFWARCDDVLGAGGQLRRAYSQLVNARESRRRKATSHDQAERVMRAAALLDEAPGYELTMPADAHRGFRPTPGLVADQVEPITRLYRALYHQMPSADLLPAIMGHLRLVDGLLGRAGNDTRRALASAVVETAGFAAWLCGDVGDAVRMLRLYGIADHAAKDSGDRALAAYVLGFRALALAERGDQLRSMGDLEAARQRAGKSAAPVLLAWLAAIHARLLAHAGRHPDALRALGAAERDLDRDSPADRPEWMYDFDRARLAAYAGNCYLRMARPVQAECALVDALDALPETSGRRRAEITVDLAYARLHAGHAGEAAWLAGEAAETFAVWGSSAGLHRVAAFGRALGTAGHAGAARSIHEQVAAYATTS